MKTVQAISKKMGIALVYALGITIIILQCQSIF